VLDRLSKPLLPGSTSVFLGGCRWGTPRSQGVKRKGAETGTRFYASQEADGHPEAKRRIVAAEGGQTVRSNVFDLSRRIRWPAPYTGRVLRNRHAETWLGRELELEARMEEVGREYAAARERGDFDIAGVIAGEACALIHDIPPAGEIVARIVVEAESLIASS
jgi:nitronate monooxygenase